MTNTHTYKNYSFKWYNYWYKLLSILVCFLTVRIFFLIRDCFNSGAALGQILGGILVSKFKMTCKNIMKFAFAHICNFTCTDFCVWHVPTVKMSYLRVCLNHIMGKYISLLFDVNIRVINHVCIYVCFLKENDE